MQVKRIAALGLAFAVVLGTCACKAATTATTTVLPNADVKNEVLLHAKTISSALVALDYEGIRENADGEDDTLRGMMEISKESDDVQERCYAKIAETLEYMVLEDTVWSTGEDTAMVDVAFTCVDYEVLSTAQVFFANEEDFKDKVETCPDKKSETITLEFSNQDNVFVLTNIEDLEAVFGFEKAAYVFAEEYVEYVGAATFEGDGFDEKDQSYYKTTEIRLSVGVTGDGQEILWKYRYEVTCDGELVFSSDDIVAVDPQKLIATYDAGGLGMILPTGEYNFLFYDYKDTCFLEVSVHVYKIAKSESDILLAIPAPWGFDFYCPDEDRTVLPGTAIGLTLVPEIHFRDADYRPLQYIMENGNPDNMMLYADDSEMCQVSMSVLFYGHVDVGSDEAMKVLHDYISQLEEGIEDRGYDYFVVSKKMTTGLYSSVMYTIDEIDKDTATNHWAVMAAGDDDVLYIVVLDSDGSVGMAELADMFAYNDRIV